jgi:hypothetical protein
LSRWGILDLEEGCMGEPWGGNRRRVLLACGLASLRASLRSAFATDRIITEMHEATSADEARAVLGSHGRELAAVICDEWLPQDEWGEPGWALLTEVELRFPDAYRAMVCDDFTCKRALDLVMHGGEPWARRPLASERIRARASASACSMPALAIAACAWADDLRLRDRQARLMAAYVLSPSRKQSAARACISEKTATRDEQGIVTRSRLPGMDAVAEEVLRRALARPVIRRGGGKRAHRLMSALARCSPSSCSAGIT